MLPTPRSSYSLWALLEEAGAVQVGPPSLPHPAPALSLRGSAPPLGAARVGKPTALLPHGPPQGPVPPPPLPSAVARRETIFSTSCACYEGGNLPEAR